MRFPGHGMRGAVSYADARKRPIEESNFGLFVAAQQAIAAGHQIENPFNGEESEVERSFLIYL
jgi:hypothetical protein